MVMTRCQYVIIFLLAGQIFLTSNAFSQCPEKIIITTDRYLYFSGENLWYKAGCFITGTNQPSPLSKVAYLELSNLNGTTVTQIKLSLEKGQGNSYMILPDTLSTGNYFLTAYTNWMRNYDNQFFATTMISVINPFRKDVFNSITKLKVPFSESEKIQSNTAVFEQLQKEYKTRSMVDLIFKNVADLNDISISVARKSLLSSHENSSKPENQSGESGSTIKLKNPPDFLPEVEGKIITGIIKNRSDNKPLVKEVVILNFVNRIASLYVTRTDNSGRFRFSVNQFGNKEMVIQPIWADTSGAGYAVELDPAFITEKVKIGPAGVPFNDSLITEINKCIINMQVEALYNSASKRSYVAKPLTRNFNFYNDPPIKTQLDKYIELPTMSEVFKEIVPSVAVRDRNNVNSFRVASENGMLLDYFAIVDGIQIKDINRIVSMNPEDVKQIEVIDLKYYFKDQELGAIINIQTKKGDLSAMNFDNRIFRQEYPCFEYSYIFPFPDYSVDSIYKSDIADFRNQLYWNPQVNVEKEGSHIRFYTSDDTGDYLVAIEGITPEGKRVRYEMPFSVIEK
jgi:hypothetical protein